MIEYLKTAVIKDASNEYIDITVEDRGSFILFRSPSNRDSFMFPKSTKNDLIKVLVAMPD